MATSATFVVEFGSTDDAFLSVELDDDKNSDKTSFSSGESVYFKVYADCDYTIEVTAGTIIEGDKGVEETVEAEVLSFIKGTAPTTAQLIKTGSEISYTWFGNDLGEITKTATNTVQAEDADDDTLGIASIDYVSEYDAYTLVPPSDMSTTYSILIYVLAG